MWGDGVGSVIQTLLGGIGSGAIYGLMGLSFALIFGKLKICSYMNGDLAILAAYACFWVFTAWNVDPFIVAVVICPLFFVIGYFVQAFFMKPFMSMELWQGRYQSQVMVTWGIGMCIMAAEYMLWSATYRTIGVSYRTSVIRVDQISIPYVDLWAIVAIVVILVAVNLILKKTTLGISLRACSNDRVSAMLSGINYQRVCAITFGISAIIAVVAGLFYTLTSQVTPSVGTDLTFKGWMAVIIGGMGSLGGAVAAGIIIGLVEALTSLLWIPALKEVVVFVGLLILLIFKPTGLFSKE